MSLLAESSEDGQMTAAKIKKEGTQEKSEDQEFGFGRTSNKCPRLGVREDSTRKRR